MWRFCSGIPWHLNIIFGNDSKQLEIHKHFPSMMQSRDLTKLNEMNVKFGMHVQCAVVFEWSNRISLKWANEKLDSELEFNLIVNC